MSARCNIMVVEDEALIALDLAMTLEEMGAVVHGPFDSVDRAATACENVDAAILDVDLRGEPVFALADRLMAQGTPFLFHTARSDTDAIFARYGRGTQILRKPGRADTLARALLTLLDETTRRRRQGFRMVRAAS